MCFPGLHLSLGIFDRLWNLLEQACTELDLHLASITTTEENGNSDSRTFDRYAASLRRLSELKNRLDAEKQTTTLLDQLTTFFSITLVDASTNSSLQRLRSQAMKAWEAVHDTVIEYCIIYVFKPNYFFKYLEIRNRISECCDLTEV